MPQLDVSTFVPQLVWLAITFVVLYLLMSKLGLPRVSAIIEARRKRLDDDLASGAAEIKAEAEAVIAAYQKTLAEARARGAGDDQGDAPSASRPKPPSGSANSPRRSPSRLKAAEREIAAAKERAFAEIRNVAVEVARSVTEKLTGSAADPRQD